MDNWTPEQWVFVICGIIAGIGTALGTLATAVLSAYGAYQARLAKIRGDDNAAKIDQNTAVTVEGTNAAATNAVAAVAAATTASAKADVITEQLNGKLEGRITAIVKAHLDPVVEQHGRDMLEIRQALGELRDWAKAK